MDSDGDDDGAFNYDFHRLLGDVDGNRIVTYDDVAKLLATFGQQNSDADTNGDGSVNILDFFSVYGSLGNSLPEEVFSN